MKRLEIHGAVFSHAFLWKWDTCEESQTCNGLLYPANLIFFALLWGVSIAISWLFRPSKLVDRYWLVKVMWLLCDLWLVKNFVRLSGEENRNIDSVLQAGWLVCHNVFYCVLTARNIGGNALKNFEAVSPLNDCATLLDVPFNCYDEIPGLSLNNHISNIIF